MENTGGSAVIGRAILFGLAVTLSSLLLPYSARIKAHMYGGGCISFAERGWPFGFVSINLQSGQWKLKPKDFLIDLPIWTLACLGGLAMHRSIILRKRAKRMECLACGYNLTGMPEPRCPECGLDFPRELGEPAA